MNYLIHVIIILRHVTHVSLESCCYFGNFPEINRLRNKAFGIDSYINFIN